MAENNAASHYETLGVPKSASLDEIKKSFRKLSMKYHPDRKTEDACAEKFKAIANAHSVLANTIERKRYDRDLAEDLLWRRGMSSSSNRNNAAAWGRNVKPPKPNGHVFIETLTNPRYFAMGIVAVGGVTLVGSLLGNVTGKRPEYHHGATLVEAWKNPKTGRFEQPAPWDKEYQRLRPKLEMVPREKVWKRQM